MCRKCASWLAVWWPAVFLGVGASLIVGYAVYVGAMIFNG